MSPIVTIAEVEWLGGRCSYSLKYEAQRAFCQNLQKKYKKIMKIPSCLCGLARGFHHELNCWSCNCLPWQHSSDEEQNITSDSEQEEARRKRDEFEEQVQQIRDEEDRRIQEDKDRRYNEALTRMEDEEEKLKQREERFERVDWFHEEKRKLKKKVLKTRSERLQHEKRRLKRRHFSEKKYALNAYDHHKAKEEYTYNQVHNKFQTLFEEASWNSHRFVNLGLSLGELEIPSFEEFQKDEEKRRQEQQRIQRQIDELLIYKESLANDH